MRLVSLEHPVNRSGSSSDVEVRGSEIQQENLRSSDGNGGSYGLPFVRRRSIRFRGATAGEFVSTAWRRQYLTSVGVHLRGTNEVQKNLIAARCWDFRAWISPTTTSSVLADSVGRWLDTDYRFETFAPLPPTGAGPDQLVRRRTWGCSSVNIAEADGGLAAPIETLLVMQALDALSWSIRCRPPRSMAVALIGAEPVECAPPRASG